VLQTNLKRSLSIAGIVVGLSLVLGLGGAYLFNSYINNEVKDIIAARVTAARLATLGPRLAQLKNEEPVAAAYTRVISLLLPSQEQLLEIPRNIEQLGQTHGVSAKFQFLGSAEPGPTKPGTWLPFSLNVSGTSEAVAAFLKDLEVTNPRYTLDMKTVDLTANTLDPGGSKLNVSGNVYYQ
jgi:Tfp pilus assembly protein PilO